MNALLAKSVDGLGAGLKMLDKRVISDSDQLQKSLSRVVADKKVLEDEFAAQRGKMGELIRELRSL